MTRIGKYVTVAVSLAAVVLIASLLTGLFYIKKIILKLLRSWRVDIKAIFTPCAKE